MFLPIYLCKGTKQKLKHLYNVLVKTAVNVAFLTFYKLVHNASIKNAYLSLQKVELHTLFHVDNQKLGIETTFNNEKFRGINCIFAPLNEGFYWHVKIFVYLCQTNAMVGQDGLLTCIR